MESKGYLLSQIRIVLQGLAHAVVWRPDSAKRHLAKRIRSGHLPEEATIQDYEALIRNIVLQPQCRIYAYTHHTQAIYAVGVNVWTGVEWLVMVGMDGVMETAFEIDSEDYLSKLSYVYLGIMGDENEGGDDVAH